jgi:succinyl-CoA synthetase beta subunit
MAANEESLDHGQVAALLESYGLRAPRGACVPADEAVGAADRIGFPVAVKATQRHLGRSLRSGVALDLPDPASVRDAITAMRDAIGADADVVVVQSMVQPGVDLRVRCTVDERIGPLISVGLGGRQVDLLRDEPIRLAPLSLASATSLINGSRAGDALREAGIGIDSVAEVIVRLGQLADEHPEIASIDVNPLMVSNDASWLTDVHVRIARRDAVVSPLRRID